MKKANYVVPSTDVLTISTSAILRDSGMVSDTPVPDMEGNAPKRHINIMYI